MKLYSVELKVIAVVEAEDENEAIQAAEDGKREIFGDVDGPDITVLSEVESLSDLTDGWDGDCIPYGGDGNTRIHELLAESKETEQ